MSNKKYSKQLKQKVINSYLNGDGSQADLERKYGITPGVLGKWMYLYRRNQEHALKNNNFSEDGIESLKPNENKDQNAAVLSQAEQIIQKLKNDNEVLKKTIAILLDQENHNCCPRKQSV